MNSLFTSSKPKAKKKHAASESPEFVKPSISINSADLLKTNPDAIKKATFEQGQKTITSAWEQLLGIKSYESGDMQPGVEVDFRRRQQEAQAAQEKPIVTTQEHSDYVREVTGIAHQQQESRGSEQRIENLIVELRRLASSVQAVEKAVVLQAIGPSGARNMKGKYYENFFEWMLSVVQDARRKVEDSGAWLQTMTSKSKKGQAVGKMKKSMNQLLSGERTAQNQTG